MKGLVVKEETKIGEEKELEDRGQLPPPCGILGHPGAWEQRSNPA